MEKAFTKPYENGWDAKPASNSWVTPEIMDNYDNAIDEIDNRVIGISEDLTQIYDDGFASRNIANINEIMIGRGWDERVAENRATLFVPIEPNVQYTISAKASTISRFQNFTLREMKTHNTLGSEGYGQNLTSSNPTVSRTSGSDIHFLSIQLELASGIFTSDKLDGINLQVEYGTEVTPYTEYAKSNTELTQIVDGNIANGYIDKVGKIEWSIGGLNFADGSENTLNTRARTNFIDVKDIPLLNVKVKANTQYGIYRYDANKNFINYHAWITDATQTIPSGTSYVRFVTTFTDTSKVITYLSDVSASIYANVPSNIELKENFSQLQITSLTELLNISSIEANHTYNFSQDAKNFKKLLIQTSRGGSQIIDVDMLKIINNGSIPFATYFSTSASYVEALNGALYVTNGNIPSINTFNYNLSGWTSASLKVIGFK